MKKNCGCHGFKAIFGTLLWVAAVLALVFGWVSNYGLDGVFWNMDYFGWFLSSVALGVLALCCQSNSCCAGCYGKCDM